MGDKFVTLKLFIKSLSLKGFVKAFRISSVNNYLVYQFGVYFAYYFWVTFTLIIVFNISLHILYGGDYNVLTNSERLGKYKYIDRFMFNIMELWIYFNFGYMLLKRVYDVWKKR